MATNKKDTFWSPNIDEKEIITVEEAKDIYGLNISEPTSIFGFKEHLAGLNPPESVLCNPSINKLLQDPKLPCNNCDGDCCGPVPYERDDLIGVFQKYSKDKEFSKRFPFASRITKIKDLEKFFKLFETHAGTMIIPTWKNTKKRLNYGTNCIFKKSNETGGCLIYDSRPQICRVYGRTDLIRCPWSGLDSQPTDEEEKKSRVLGTQRYSHEKMRDFAGVNGLQIPSFQNITVERNLKILK